MRKELLRGDGGRRSAALMQTIETVAGTGEMFGVNDDGLPATEVAIRFPMQMAVGPDGTLYFPESMGHRVRSVRPDGTTYSVAGTGSLGFSGDGDQATQAKLKAPSGVDVGLDGSLYIADNLNHCIRKVDPSGIITTVAGIGGEKGFEGDEGLATSAKLNSPYDVAMGFDGCLYIADTGNYRVRKVSPDGYISTLAGNGVKEYGGDDGPATNASFFSPSALAIGPEGNVYIGDVGSYRVRVVEPSGIVRTVAGSGQPGYSGDGGQAIQADLTPDAIALAPGGGLYIVSSNVHRVRLVSPEGVITTVAGSGSTVVGEGGFGGDGGIPASARINRPQGSLSLPMEPSTLRIPIIIEFGESARLCREPIIAVVRSFPRTGWNCTNSAPRAAISPPATRSPGKSDTPSITTSRGFWIGWRTPSSRRYRSAGAIPPIPSTRPTAKVHF